MKCRSVAVAFAVLSFARGALAEEPGATPPPATPAFVPPAATTTDPASARLASMQRLMATLEEPARTYRYAGGLTAMGLGVVTVPLSAMMLERGSATEMGPVILLGLGFGEVVGGAFILITPGSYASGYSRVVDRIVAGRRAGEPEGKILEEAERVWQEQADLARSGRRAVGGIALALGVVASGVGIGLDAAAPLGGLSRADQDGFSAGAFALGYASILAGVRSFVFPTPVEVSWQAYRAGWADPAKPATSARMIEGLRPIALRGGMGVGWGAEF